MRQTIELTVNGRAERVEIKPHWTLVQMLRDGLLLNGTKEACGEGSCGSCTVLLDGVPVRACLSLAVRAEGKCVETVEGLSHNGDLHPIQQAFVDCGAIQCGFCTAGMMMSTKALLSDNPEPDEEEIREYLSGNFCRCGGYTLIFDAVRRAAEEMSAS